MGAPRVTEAAIKRAIDATSGLGKEIGAVVVNNIEGTVRIEFAQPSESEDAPRLIEKKAPRQWGAEDD